MATDTNVKPPSTGRFAATLNEVQQVLLNISRQATGKGIDLRPFLQQTPTMNQLKKIVIDCFSRLGKQVESCLIEANRRIANLLRVYRRVIGI